MTGKRKSYVGYFPPGGAENNLQKKESTMLPQATAAFAYILILNHRVDWVVSQLVAAVQKGQLDQKRDLLHHTAGHLH